MEPSSLSVVLNIVLGLAVFGLALKLVSTVKRHRVLVHDSAYARGAADARRELLDSIRYEREVYECRRTGLVRKETVLKIRENVMLGNLRLAHSDHEITLTSEVDQENIWQLIDRTGQAFIAPDLGRVVKTLSPSVQRLFASRN